MTAVHRAEARRAWREQPPKETTVNAHTYPCCACCTTDLPHIEADTHTIACQFCQPDPAATALAARAWDEGRRLGLRQADYEMGAALNMPDLTNPYRQTEGTRA